MADETVVMVGDGQSFVPTDKEQKREEPLEVIVEGEDPPESQDQDERLSADERDPDLETGGTEDQREERRQRLTSKERRELRRHYRQMDQAQIEGLKQSIETLQRQIVGMATKVQEADRGQVAAQFEEGRRRLEILQAQYARAINEGNGVEAVQAQSQINSLRPVVDNLYRALQQPIQPPQIEAPLAPAAVEHARTFMARHQWWDPEGKDAESRAVLAIDENLKREGWDESTVTYWQELERRMQNHPTIDRQRFADLPPPVDGRDVRGRFAPQDDRQARRGPPVGGGSTAGGRSVTIPKELKDAMVQAGIYDDKVARDRAIKDYLSKQPRK